MQQARRHGHSNRNGAGPKAYPRGDALQCASHPIGGVPWPGLRAAGWIISINPHAQRYRMAPLFGDALEVPQDALEARLVGVMVFPVAEVSDIVVAAANMRPLAHLYATIASFAKSTRPYYCRTRDSRSRLYCPA
jgi:hypothetical protein